MANTEALISAVESRCICAIERAPGGAGWFGFQQALHGILGTLFWGKGKTLRATKIPQLIFWNRISGGSMWNLGHSFLAENFACGEKKKPQLSFWNNFHRLSMESWALCFGGKLKTLLCVAKQPQLIFWNKISPGITGEKACRVFTLPRLIPK
jgi:hypothetical protein